MRMCMALGLCWVKEAETATVRERDKGWKCVLSRHLQRESARNRIWSRMYASPRSHSSLQPGSDLVEAEP